MNEKEIVQSVVKALSILELVSENEVGLIELSKKVELNKTTVHRLLNTLIYTGYVIQNPENNKYKITSRALSLSGNFLKGLDIVKIARPYIRELSEVANEVVHLVALDGEDIVYIDKIDSENTIRMHSYIGKRIPIYSTAVGKAFIAYSDEESFDEIWKRISSHIKKLTPNTITDKEIMYEEIKKIREQGFAIDDEENELGVICIAAPIFNFKGKMEYAISISTPQIRINKERLDEFKRLIKTATNSISKELGYKF